MPSTHPDPKEQREIEREERDLRLESVRLAAANMPYGSDGSDLIARAGQILAWIKDGQ